MDPPTPVSLVTASKPGQDPSTTICNSSPVVPAFEQVVLKTRHAEIYVFLGHKQRSVCVRLNIGNRPVTIVKLDESKFTTTSSTASADPAADTDNFAQVALILYQSWKHMICHGCRGQFVAVKSSASFGNGMTTCSHLGHQVPDRNASAEGRLIFGLHLLIFFLELPKRKYCRRSRVRSVKMRQAIK